MGFQVPGSITSTTRRVYELKLQSLKMTNDDRTSDPTPANLLKNCEMSDPTSLPDEELRRSLSNMRFIGL